MEEVLDLYEEPYDPKRPMICFDEQPYQMLSEVRDPLPMKPGQPERVDFEYEREGNAYVHMTFEPLKGFREVEITERRRSVEFAHLMEHLVDDLYPEAEEIRVVLDDLSTHTGAAFYEAFPAQRARSLATKIEFIYTPVHGSWLNMAEIELSVLGRQCLKRRIPDTKTLRREAKAWQKERNRLGRSVEWRFTTEDARTKLRILYPSEKV
jgi:DDE superfamily endonuclease